MREPEVAPCPAGGELENMIIIMKKENAMQTFYDDTLKHLDPCSMKSRFNTLFQCLGIPFEDTNIEALMNDSCLDYDGIIHKNLQTEKEKSLRYLKNIVTDVSNLK